MTSPLKTTLLLLIFVLMSGCNTSPEVEEKNGEEASRIQETLSTDEQTNTLVPKDWKLVQSATGDLNWDNRDDHALIVEQNIGTDLLEGAYAFPNRKILVFFADTKNGDFELIAENDSLIPIQTENMEEPLQNIQITDGLLEIGLEMFYGSGTWETQRTSYTFVYKNEALLLAEANGQLIFRNTLDFEKYRFDFEHQKWTKEKGNMSDDESILLSQNLIIEKDLLFSETDNDLFRELLNTMPEPSCITLENLRVLEKYIREEGEEMPSLDSTTERRMFSHLYHDEEEHRIQLDYDEAETQHSSERWTMKKEGEFWLAINYGTHSLLPQEVLEIQVRDSEDENKYIESSEAYTSFCEVINNMKQAEDPSLEKITNPYSIQDNRVFLGNFEIQGADTETFEVMEFPYAKDKENVYYGVLPMKREPDVAIEENVVNPQSFEVINNIFSQDKNNVYAMYDKGSDPYFFETDTLDDERIDLTYGSLKEDSSVETLEIKTKEIPEFLLNEECFVVEARDLNGDQKEDYIIQSRNRAKEDIENNASLCHRSYTRDKPYHFYQIQNAFFGFYYYFDGIYLSAEDVYQLSFFSFSEPCRSGQCSPINLHFTDINADDIPEIIVDAPFSSQIFLLIDDHYLPVFQCKSEDLSHKEEGKIQIQEDGTIQCSRFLWEEKKEVITQYKFEEGIGFVEL